MFKNLLSKYPWRSLVVNRSLAPADHKSNDRGDLVILQVRFLVGDGSTNRDAICPDFSGIPDFHKFKIVNEKPIITIKNWIDLLLGYCLSS